MAQSVASCFFVNCPQIGAIQVLPSSRGIAHAHFGPRLLPDAAAMAAVDCLRSGASVLVLPSDAAIMSAAKAAIGLCCNIGITWNYQCAQSFDHIVNTVVCTV